MAYQSQLVVRTRDPQRAEIIEQVKNRANEAGKTYSEMALELLERGLGADEARPEQAAKPADEPREPEEAEADAPEEPVIEDKVAADGGSPSVVQSEPGSAASPEGSAEKAETREEAVPDEPNEAVPDVELPEDGSVEAVATACLEYFEDEGPRAATQLLAEFFATAGPVEGGQVKDELQSRLDDADYETIFEGLRDTEQYRTYRQRVIFGS